MTSRLPGAVEQVPPHVGYFAEAGEADPDHAVREDLDALDRVGDAGQVALAVQVDQRVVLVQLVHGLAVELLALGEVLGLAGLGRAARPSALSL